MKIGIYNRYWRTRGGGERYAGVVAEVLARDHEVELLGPETVGPTDLGDHLGLDLEQTTFRLLPPVGERELAPLTAEYDLLVNCTYLSRLPSRARKSVYLVLFPQRAWPAAVVRSGRRLLAAVAPELPPPVVPLEGFYENDARGRRWSRNAARLRVQPWAFRRGRARVWLAAPEARGLRESILEIRSEDSISWRVQGGDLVLELPRGSSPAPIDVELRCRTWVPAETGASEDHRRLGVYLASQGFSKARARLRSVACRAGGFLDGHDAAIPSSYDLLVSISQYTRQWVGRRWGRDSEVLAPPVDVDTFTPPDPLDKERILLSVGRFFHGSHNKKHLEMLRVFRGMVDRGGIPEGWEYHLVGNLHRSRLVDLEYFAELERLAAGYPVEILVDVSLDRLIEEYRRASIFWHAAGWGESERRNPEKLEHFGLTTCEAMSSGCIPVVIAKAGQLEIVEDGETGFLFETGRQLSSITRRLIEGYGEPWTRDLMARARSAVLRFGRAPFEERLLEIFTRHGLLE